MFTCEFCDNSADHILSYYRKGDRIQLEACFHLVCAEHSLVPVDWNAVFDDIQVVPANEEEIRAVLAWI